MNRVIQPKVKVTLVQGEFFNGTNSAFALGPRKTTENLDRVGQLQDLLDAN
jgi:hypothetical protein